MLLHNVTDQTINLGTSVRVQISGGLTVFNCPLGKVSCLNRLLSVKA